METFSAERKESRHVLPSSERLKEYESKIILYDSGKVKTSSHFIRCHRVSIEQAGYGLEA